MCTPKQQHAYCILVQYILYWQSSGTRVSPYLPCSTSVRLPNRRDAVGMVFFFGTGPRSVAPGGRLGTLARGTVGVAATIFGLRVSRAVTLRISALLCLRSLLAPLQLPLDSGLGAFLWSGAFAAAQTAAVAAAAADRLHLPGVLGRWGAALFSPVDAPFVSLYAAVVLICGPLTAVIETVIAVYEAVRVTRVIENHINSSPEPGAEAFWKRVNLSAAATSLLFSAALIGFLPVSEVFFASLGLTILLFVLSLVTVAGNALHAGLLSLYTSCLLIAALSEHLDLFPEFGEGPRQTLHSPESRAVLLVISSVTSLVCLSRAPQFLRVILYSADAVSEDSSLFSGPGAVERGVLNSLGIVSLTFRFLVFHRDILQGEYYPLVCRGLQIMVVVCLYSAFMRIEGNEGEE